jgi:serine/threonine protein kinase
MTKPFQLAAAREQSAFQTGQKLGGFTLGSMIGVGVMGEVWEAVHERTDHLVALRIFDLVGVPGGLQSLRHEFEVARALRHTNIVRVYGLKSSEETALLAMELIRGWSLDRLSEILRERSLRFPPAAVLDVGLALVRALDYAWTKPDIDGAPLQLVHRDLAPAKIQVSMMGDVRVGGFSVARTLGSSGRTATGVIKGGIECMSPERMTGSSKLGPPTDLWAVGVILWELATGRAFYGSSRLTRIARTCRERSNVEEAATLAGFFPDLAPIVQRLLARKFEARPQTAAEVLLQLETLAASSPCEGGLQQVAAQVPALERIGDGPGPSPEACSWDEIVVRVGGQRPGIPREGATPRVHEPGRGVCWRPGTLPPAPDDGGQRTQDWTTVPEEDPGGTDDWSTIDETWDKDWEDDDD